MLNVRMMVIRLRYVCLWRLRELDKRGGPRKTWWDCVDDMKSFGLSCEDAQDKDDSRERSKEANG